MAYDILAFKSAVSAMSGNGSWRARNSRDGADWVEEVKMIKQFCFVMEIRESEKRLSGNKDYSRETVVSCC